MIQSQTPDSPPSHFTAGDRTGFIDWEDLLSFSFLAPLNVGTRDFTSLQSRRQKTQFFQPFNVSINHFLAEPSSISETHWIGQERRVDR